MVAIERFLGPDEPVLWAARPHAAALARPLALAVVIVILALLIGLLLPAIQGAVKTAREAAISAEIQTLSQALAQFKSDFGDYPPSRIVLVENGDYSTANLGGAATAFSILQPRSLLSLRKFWPRMVIWPKLPKEGSTLTSRPLVVRRSAGSTEVCCQPGWASSRTR